MLGYILSFINIYIKRPLPLYPIYGSLPHIYGVRGSFAHLLINFEPNLLGGLVAIMVM